MLSAGEALRCRVNKRSVKDMRLVDTLIVYNIWVNSFACADYAPHPVPPSVPSTFVEIENGKLRGSDFIAYREFLGIPFGQPPVLAFLAVLDYNALPVAKAFTSICHSNRSGTCGTCRPCLQKRGNLVSGRLQYQDQAVFVRILGHLLLLISIFLRRLSCHSCHSTHSEQPSGQVLT